MEMKALRIMLVVALVVCAGDRAIAGVLRAEMLRAIIGESADQSIEGQTAVACAIINRPEGLSGVYGADMTRKPSAKELKQAEVALAIAEGLPEICRDLIQGADMWHSDYPPPESWLGVPMIFIKQIGDHYFYRRITKGTNG